MIKRPLYKSLERESMSPKPERAVDNFANAANSVIWVTKPEDLAQELSKRHGRAGEIERWTLEVKKKIVRGLIVKVYDEKSRHVGYQGAAGYRRSQQQLQTKKGQKLPYASSKPAPVRA